MLINKNLSQDILNNAGPIRTSKAKKYIDEGRVNIIKSDYENQDNFSLTSIVTGTLDEYEVNIDIKKGELEVASCECEDYLNHYSACKHIVATLMKFEQTKFWDNEYRESEKIEFKQSKNEQYKYRSFNNLINTFYNDELQDVNSNDIVRLAEKDKIKIETKIDYDKFSNRLKT